MGERSCRLRAGLRHWLHPPWSRLTEWPRGVVGAALYAATAGLRRWHRKSRRGTTLPRVRADHAWSFSAGQARLGAGRTQRGWASGAAARGRVCGAGGIHNGRGSSQSPREDVGAALYAAIAEVAVSTASRAVERRSHRSGRSTPGPCLVPTIADSAPAGHRWDGRAELPPAGESAKLVASTMVAAHRMAARRCGSGVKRRDCRTCPLAPQVAPWNDAPTGPAGPR